MKIIKIASIFAVCTALFFTSCSSSEEENGGGGTNPDVTITYLVVSADAATVVAGEIINLSSIAIMSDGSEVDKTAESTFYVSGMSLASNQYIGSAIGDILVKAAAGSTMSDEITIQGLQPVTLTAFSKKAVIEDYTGTWCGYCPRVSYAISLVEEQSDKVFAIAAHIGDDMQNSYSVQLEDNFDIPGYPTAYVNRASEWAYPEPNNVAQATSIAQGTTTAGLAINSILTNNTLEVVVSTSLTETINSTKLVVFVLEDGIVASQVNYTNHYSGNPVDGFVHDHVLRYAATNVLGDITNGGAGTHHTAFKINLPSTIQDAENTGIVAMLVDATGKIVYNAQYAAVNVDKDFD